MNRKASYSALGDKENTHETLDGLRGKRWLPILSPSVELAPAVPPACQRQVQVALLVHRSRLRCGCRTNFTEIKTEP